MNDFFSHDGPVMKYGNMLADMVMLSFIWILFSIPTFTIGAATTAAYYVATRRISEKSGYLFVDFFTSFKREFIRSTAIFVPMFAMCIIVFLNIVNLAGDDSTLGAILLPIQFLLLLEAAVIFLYICPLTSRFDMKKKDLVKTAFFMAHRHFLTTLILIAMVVGLIAVTFVMFPFFIMLVPGIFIYMSSYLFMRVFRKYRPEMDAEVTDEEIAETLRKGNDNNE